MHYDTLQKRETRLRNRLEQLQNNEQYYNHIAILLQRMLWSSRQGYIARGTSRILNRLLDKPSKYRKSYPESTIMELKKNQAALILEISDEGEISVDVAASDMEDLPGALCHAIARKLLADEKFQGELMDMVG